MGTIDDATIKSHTDKLIHEWASISNIPSFKVKWFLLARDMALESESSHSRTGCVLVYKSQVVGSGSCYTQPAEYAALDSILPQVAKSLDWSQVEAYNCRILEDSSIYTGLALPIEISANKLADKGISSVYYTTGNPFKPLGHCDL